MTTPQQLDDVAATAGSLVLRAVAAAQAGIASVIARRLTRQPDVPQWLAAKRTETQAVILAAADVVRASGLRLAARAAAASGVRAGAVSAASALASVAAQQSSRVTVGGGLRAQALLAVESELDGTVQTVEQALLRSTRDRWRSTIADVERSVLAGAATRRDATRRAVESWASEGLTGIVDASGRRWSAESYAEMAVRTATVRASREAQGLVLQSDGLDLVQISDHGGECERCRPWEGTILSLSESGRRTVTMRSAVDDTDVRVDVAGGLDEARSAGLFHPNCRHTYSAYVPGVTQPLTATEDPEGSAARTRQRSIERRIREWKTREQAARDAGDPAGAARSRAKVQAWHQEMRRHLSANPTLRRRSDREQITRPPSDVLSRLSGASRVPTASRESLGRLVDADGTSFERLFGGETSATYLATSRSGERAVLKSPRDGQDDEDARFFADGEYLASTLADTIDAPLARVARLSGSRVAVEYVDGEPVEDRDVQRLLQGRDAERIGLVDVLTGYTDRRTGLRTTPAGQLAGFDSGGSWLLAEIDDPTLFVAERNAPSSRWLNADGSLRRGQLPMSRRELQRIRQRVSRLGLTFDRLGRRPWLNRSLRALDEIIDAAS